MKFLRANAPTFPLNQVRLFARQFFGLSGEARALYSERDQNTVFRESDGSAWVLKIANGDEDPGAVECQIEALQHIQRVDPALPVPRVRRTLERQTTALITAEVGTKHVLYALSYLDGHIAGGRALDPPLLRRIGAIQARLGLAMRGFFHRAAGDRKLLWDVRMAPEYREFVEWLPAGQQALAQTVLRRGIESIVPHLAGLRAQVIHGDLHAYNLILDGTGEIGGIIDFGDMIHGPLVLDLSNAVGDFLTSPSRIPLILEHLVGGYHEIVPLESGERSVLVDLIELRLVIGLIVNAYRRERTPDEPNYGADVGFGGIEVIEALRHARPQLEAIVDAACGIKVAAAIVDAACGIRAPTAIVDAACGIEVPAAAARVRSQDIVARRKRLMGSRPYLFYERPIHAVRGDGVWLIDSAGRRFLDCYNNVPIVGHCHPVVAEAIARQSRVLNTNTRYLGEQVLDYAEALGARAGGGLTACAFVNSGSEANDVAWRMATAWTGARGALAMEFAYHGITEAIDAVSPSASRVGAVAAHVRTLIAPDGYRGIYRTGTADLGRRYAEDADRAIRSLADAGLKPAAFFVDSAFMTNGILEPQQDYVAEVFRRVRAAGGLCIADEVQSGFGRMGGHFYGYRHHDVVPDIITIGKPAGNGHPIGVVVTRPEILDRFVEQTMFFSTFGGNNVSCAAGLAVLEVLDNEDLINNAATVGAYFKTGLKSLMERYELIGDVRATGLGIGIELVSDRDSRAPAAEATARLVNRLRDEGVLVGSEGVHGNIIKMRPPLVFRREHADIALDAFERSLSAG